MDCTAQGWLLTGIFARLTAGGHASTSNSMAYSEYTTAVEGRRRGLGFIAAVYSVRAWPKYINSQIALVLMGLQQLTATMMRHFEVARESQIRAVEVREPCSDMLDTLDVVDHPTQCQIASSSERHNISVFPVLIDVPRRCGHGFSGRLVVVDPFAFERDLGRVVTDHDVVMGPA